MRTVPKGVGERWFLVISSSSTSQKHNIFRDTSKSLFASFFPSSLIEPKFHSTKYRDVTRREKREVNNRKENRKREKKKNKNDGPRKSSGINITRRTFPSLFSRFLSRLEFLKIFECMLVKKNTERKLNLWCKPENECIIKYTAREKTRTRLPGLEGTLRDITRSCDSRHLKVSHRSRYYSWDRIFRFKSESSWGLSKFSKLKTQTLEIFFFFL